MTTKNLEDETLTFIAERYGLEVARAIKAMWSETEIEIDLSAIAYQIKNTDFSSESSS